MLWEGKARLGEQQGPHKSMAEKGFSRSGSGSSYAHAASLSCWLGSCPARRGGSGWVTETLFCMRWPCVGVAQAAWSRRGHRERREGHRSLPSPPLSAVWPQATHHLSPSFIRWGQGSCSGLKETILQTLAERVLRGGLGAGSEQLETQGCPHVACCVAGKTNCSNSHL